jgi:formate-dependent phosphoribosylglycinamide formyltransferase (GAR transformylase)
MIIGTPLAMCAVKMMLLGAEELGKEVTIEAQRLRPSALSPS